MMYDEGPSEEDLERFSTGDAYCPECGASIFDEIDICPACRARIGGRILRKPPKATGEDLARRSHIILIVVLILLIAGFGGVLIRLF